MRRIKKIKIDKTDKIIIEYEVTKGGGKIDEYTLQCTDAPRPELKAALEALRDDVADLCEIPDKRKKISPRGVSFSYGGDKEVMGATISASMQLTFSNCPLNLNTPHKASDSYSDCPADPTQILKPTTTEKLNTLIAEVEKYIDGERGQQKLDLK